MQPRGIYASGWTQTGPLSFAKKPAYFYVAVYLDHSQFVRSALKVVTYRYQVLPFGLSVTSQTLTKCFEAALVPLKDSGIPVIWIKLVQDATERKRQCNCCWICHTIWISQWPFSKACYPDSVVVRNVGSKYAHLSATYICQDTECHVSCQPRLFSVGMLIGLPKDFSFLISLLFFLLLSLLSIRMFQCWTVSHYRLPKLAYWLFTLRGSPGCWARSLQLERCLFPRSCPQTPLQGDGAAFPVLCWFIQDVYLFDHLFVC